MVYRADGGIRRVVVWRAEQPAGAAIDGDEENIIGIELYDAEQDKTVVRFDSYLFELEALTFLRWLVVTKRLELSYFFERRCIDLLRLNHEKRQPDVPECTA
ncbi:hypothetical protein ACUTQ5_15805 [Serratia sp. NA_112.1]|uniref:hypothetical protein n=1 Tax=Serratia sp. NA_112.1 TaxID=3415665 RepID=UPI004046F59A